MTQVTKKEIKKCRTHAHPRPSTREVGRPSFRFAGWAVIIGSLVI